MEHEQQTNNLLKKSKRNQQRATPWGTDMNPKQLKQRQQKRKLIHNN